MSHSLLVWACVSYSIWSISKVFQSHNVVPHSPSVPRFKRRLIKKTILVSGLHARDSSKASSLMASRLVHSVITQVIITLDGVRECNVSFVAEKVKDQLGFEVVHLDSKLFPITENESTCGSEFWRSTQKVIAANCVSYEKLVGVTVGEELNQLDEDDDVTTEPPSKRVKNANNYYEDVSEKVDEVIKKLDVIDRKLSVFDELKKTFECVICCSVVKSVISRCCK